MKSVAFHLRTTCNRFKKLVRSGQNPLAQVSKHMIEIEHSQRTASAQPEERPKMYISTKKRDSCFLMEDDRFAFVQERREDGMVVCSVLKQRHTANFF